jgi:hypothetical protein
MALADRGRGQNAAAAPVTRPEGVSASSSFLSTLPFTGRLMDMTKFTIVPRPFVRWILLALILSSAGRALQQPPLEGVAAERVLLTSGESDLLVGFPEEQYRKQVAPLVGRNIRNLLLMRKKPESLTSGARFGSGFGLEGEIRGVGWILDGNDREGYVLYLDLNVNGDLSDDPPVRFQKEAGAYSRTFGPRRDSSSPGLMKLSVIQLTRPGESAPVACLRINRLAMRRGSIRAGNRDVAFGLIGGLGIYTRVVFDLDGDGTLDTAHLSREYYNRDEEFVRLGETDYEFAIGRNGDSLQLKPLPERLPDTQILRPGYPPPDFTFQDMDGKTHRLSEYRGKVVLLDFWMINCGWCQGGDSGNGRSLSKTPCDGRRNHRHQRRGCRRTSTGVSRRKAHDVATDDSG